MHRFGERPSGTLRGSPVGLAGRGDDTKRHDAVRGLIRALTGPNDDAIASVGRDVERNIGRHLRELRGARRQGGRTPDVHHAIYSHQLVAIVDQGLVAIRDLCAKQREALGALLG